MKIAILGTRGIPNHHGGFEQFAGFVVVVHRGWEAIGRCPLENTYSSVQNSYILQESVSHPSHTPIPYPQKEATALYPHPPPPANSPIIKLALTSLTSTWFPNYRTLEIG